MPPPPRSRVHSDFRGRLGLSDSSSNLGVFIFLANTYGLQWFLLRRNTESALVTKRPCLDADAFVFQLVESLGTMGPDKPVCLLSVGDAHLLGVCFVPQVRVLFSRSHRLLFASVVSMTERRGGFVITQVLFDTEEMQEENAKRKFGSPGTSALNLRFSSLVGAGAGEVHGAGVGRIGARLEPPRSRREGHVPEDGVDGRAVPDAAAAAGRAPRHGRGEALSVRADATRPRGHFRSRQGDCRAGETCTTEGRAKQNQGRNQR